MRDEWLDRIAGHRHGIGHHELSTTQEQAGLHREDLLILESVINDFRGWWHQLAAILPPDLDPDQELEAVPERDDAIITIEIAAMSITAAMHNPAYASLDHLSRLVLRAEGALGEFAELLDAAADFA